MPLERHCSTTAGEMMTLKLAVCGVVLFLLKGDSMHCLMEELVPDLSICCRKRLSGVRAATEASRNFCTMIGYTANAYG